MKTLYLECNMGAAGDMLMAALLELLPEKNCFLEEMNHLGISGLQILSHPAEKCGICGTHMQVLIHGEEELCHNHDHDHPHDHSHDHSHGHQHHSLSDIEHIISHLSIPEDVKTHAFAVYQLIAEAEGHAHGRPVTDIHFHEVGSMDAIADIVGVCLLIQKLAPEKIVVSPVCTGFGQVHCAHGILPVPAPATAYLLQGIPTYSGQIQGELCTPTGAALLRHFADSFSQMPVMRVEKIGYGMGNKDFPAANCIRAMIGDTADQAEEIWEASCNLDDITAEEIGFAMDQLFEAGAVDVFTTPIGMKKNRPAIMLTCLYRETNRDQVIHALFHHTSTLGIREHKCTRYTLTRDTRIIRTPYGDVRLKTAGGYGVQREKAEYEDLSRIARENHLSLCELKKELHFSK